MQILKIVFVILLTIILRPSFAQNWYSQSYSIEFEDVKTIDEFEELSFYAVEGSRTNSYAIAFNDSTHIIRFSFQTMGGEDASLIIEKNSKRMVMLYGMYYPDVSRNTNQLNTKGKFREGHFTSFDGFFWEISEEAFAWWLLTHQNDEPTLIAD